MNDLDRLMIYDRDHPGSAGTSAEEKLFLYGLVRMIQPRVMIEIGVRAGHMTCWLALAIKHNGRGHLHSVDNWLQTNGGGGGSEAHARTRLKAVGLLDHHVTFYKMDSDKFLAKQKDRSADIVWIDGGHEFDVALSDIREAIRVSRNVVGVHDAHNLPGVYDAIKEIEALGFVGTWLDGFRGTWVYDVTSDRRPPEGSKYR